MQLTELTEGCLTLNDGNPPADITGIACDSRQIQPGHLFVAVSGEATDGHRFCVQAERAGAAAIVGEKSLEEIAALCGRPTTVPYFQVEDSRAALSRLASSFFGYPQRDLILTGITGTKGKTTTSWVLDAILRSCGATTALVGTVYNRIGATGYPSTNTTPSSLQLIEYLNELRSIGGSHAVLEVSSHGIAQRRVGELEFTCGILTNVAPEHLDYHKTFESYLNVKAKLFEGLRSDSFAILPREEVISMEIAPRTKARICWYGADSPDGVEKLRMGTDVMTFEWKGIPVRSRLWGLHNLQNVLAAMTAAECMGFDRQDIARGVESAVAPPGRLEEVESKRPFKVFVDYAHTDGSLETVLRTLKTMTRGRLITVFGCGGDRDKEKRPRMGAVAERWSDQVVLTSDNPRHEEPNGILDDISRGLSSPEDAVLEPCRREAIALGIRMAREGDIILVAGKGHETYQEVNDERLPFDDRAVVREYLNEGERAGD